MEDNNLRTGIAVVVATVVTIGFIHYTNLVDISRYFTFLDFTSTSRSQFFTDISREATNGTDQNQLTAGDQMFFDPTAFDEFLVPTGVNGVRYFDLRAVEEGADVKAGDNVSVSYIGLLENGTLFDQSQPGQFLDFVVGSTQVIKGFSDGIVGMKKNSIRLIKIPAAAAYGEKQVASIPPNSTLYFILTLQDIQ